MRWLKYIYEQYKKDVEMPFEAKLYRRQGLLSRVVQGK